MPFVNTDYLQYLKSNNYQDLYPITIGSVLPTRIEIIKLEFHMRHVKIIQ